VIETSHVNHFGSHPIDLPRGGTPLARMLPSVIGSPPSAVMSGIHVLFCSKNVVRVDEDDAGLFERPLYRFEGACLHPAPALEVRHRLRRYSGRIGEVPEVPAKSRPREKRLHPENWSHVDPCGRQRWRTTFPGRAAPQEAQ
jgi:hypothetical protein